MSEGMIGWARGLCSMRTATRLVVVAAFAGLPFFTSGFQTFQLSMAVQYGLALIGLSILTGLSGQISLGHGAFFGIGAYATAILVSTHGVAYPLALVASAGLCLVVGALFGLPALRLRGLYLALLTLGLSTALPVVIRRFDSVTGGSSGINVPSRVVRAPAWTGLSFDQYLYFITLTVAVLGFIVARRLLDGPVGRILVGVRDNEIAMSCLGVDVARVKVAAFALSSAYAGISGGLYALLIGYVAPTSFTVLLSITMLAALVVGGATSLRGAMIGGAFLQFAPHYTSSISPSAAGLVYGVLLIAVMLTLPSGASGGLTRLKDLLLRTIRRNDPESLSAGSEGYEI